MKKHFSKSAPAPQEADTQMYVVIQVYEESRMGYAPRAISVRDEREAVKIALEKGEGDKSFETYEITSVKVNGEVLTGEPRNHRKYCVADKVFTRDETVAQAEARVSRLEAETPDRQSGFLIQHSRDHVQGFKNDPAESVYIRGSVEGINHRLEPDTRVYDWNGDLLWPAAKQAAAPKPPLAP